MSVDFRLEGHVAHITMNRPEKLNALDAESYRALSAAWTRVRDDRDVRVAVISGAGDRAFTTGADLDSFVGKDSSYYNFMLTQNDLLLNRGLEVWKPVIAAINGYCLGGGMTLMLASDIRIATDTAQFALSEVTRGIVPGNGGTQRILEQLPYPVAMELLTTGRWMDAAEAERWGLVNRVVPARDLLITASEVAQSIADNPPLAVQGAKELAIRSRGLNRNDGLRLEAAINRVLEHTEDFQEAMAAFQEGRDGEYGGK